MSTETVPGGFGEVSSVSTAGGGSAITAAASQIVLPLGTRTVALLPRDFSTAVVVQWQKIPWLTILKTTDLLVTEPTNYSYEAQDGSTSTDVTLSSLGTAAQGDFLYVGSHLPFAGVTVDVDAANGTASVITVKYRKSDGTWADISDTDGSANGGASMGQDGSITWTIPADWSTARLFDTGDTAINAGFGKQELYWTRWEWSAGLDASTTLNSMIAIPRLTGYVELPSGIAWEESVTVGPGGISGLYVKTDAGTAKLVVNTASRGRFGS